MTGVDMRKLKRAISSRVNPMKRPVVMVAPLRETPGTSAATCDSPMRNARGRVISSSVRTFGPTRSAM